MSKRYTTEIPPMFVVKLLHRLELPHLRSNLVAMARTVMGGLQTQSLRQPKKVKTWHVWRSCQLRYRSPSPHQTFGQLIVEKCSHGQKKMGWCSILFLEWKLFWRYFRSRAVAALQRSVSELLHVTWNLKCFSTCTKLFHCFNYSGTLNTARCNRNVHFETFCIMRMLSNSWSAD